MRNNRLPLISRPSPRSVYGRDNFGKIFPPEIAGYAKKEGQTTTMRHKHVDPTRCILRPENVGRPIHGAEEAIAFLDAHLLNRGTLNDRLFPGKRVAMLYGREGSGKTSLLHRSEYHTGALGFVHQFRVQHWNFKEFTEWAETCLTIIGHMAEDQCNDRRHDRDARAPENTTIIIAGV